MEKRLVIWVEGDRDKRFFEAVIKPQLVLAYPLLLVREYRQQKTADINRLLAAMSHEGFKRLFIADLNSAPCIKSRKEKVRARYPALDDREIIVVSKEIESWYLAGLTVDGRTALKVDPPPSTDGLTKDDFDRLRAARFDSELDFLLELLKYFDIPTACRRNKSFAYFHRMRVQNP